MPGLALRVMASLALVAVWASPALAGIGDLPAAYYLAPVGALVSLAFAFYFYHSVMQYSEGEPEMIRIAQAVREGAYAYLRRQYVIVAGAFVLLVVVLLGLSWGLGLVMELTAVGVPVAGVLSGLCGYFGMRTATNASSRTTAAAKHSLNDGLRVAFRAGAVMGLCVTGFALLDVSLWFLLLNLVFEVDPVGLVQITTLMLSFAMGASLQALFARVGGGIYTKAADVGADLVGKVEAGIPEDDPRNPATIADNVGDNVGDVAGMGADLYESYYGSMLASMALGAAAALQLDLSLADGLKLVVVPPALAGLGILASVASIFLVRAREGASMAQLLKSLHMGVWASSGMIVVASFLLLYWILGDVTGVSGPGIWGAIIAGLAAGLVIAQGTEFYTSYERGPTQRISHQAQTGPATVIIAGVAEGMKSTWIPLLTIVVAILTAFIAAGGNQVFLLGVFGVGVAAVGMFSTLGITLATDAYGPIADNAGGNAQMTQQPEFVRERTDMLDSLGNTTAATGKGFAIGSAALTALALLAAYTITVRTSLDAQVVQHYEEQTVEPGLHYHRHGLFLIVEQEQQASGLLLAPRNRRQIQSALDEQMPFEAEFDTDRGLHVAHLEDGRQFDVVRGDTATLPELMAYYDVTLMNPRVLGGMFLGVMLVFVFCALTMSAVGRAAFAMMQECRRQFAIMREQLKKQGTSEQDIADPTRWPIEIMVDGKRYPDYANCVAISTAGAQREMITPAALAISVPILVGLVLGVPGVMGLLAGALTSGFAVAIFMANSGGAWDNAKKYIELGHYGGKGSEAHKAGVVGDTVGDPFKDTSGPSLNILIKLISIVSVVFAGLIVRFSPQIAELLGLD